MSADNNPLLALKHAWRGAVAAADRVRELAPQVDGLPDGTPLADLDLTTYHHAALAQANAMMALQGLVEQLQRIRAADSA